MLRVSPEGKIKKRDPTLKVPLLFVDRKSMSDIEVVYVHRSWPLCSHVCVSITVSLL